MNRLTTFLKLAACCLTLAFGVRAQVSPEGGAARQKTSQAAAQGARAEYVPVHKYDPKRDAARDVEEAVAEAARTNRRVLVEVGGEWCVWCHIMDDFFEKNRAVLDLREQNFVMVKVNFSDENKNEPVLSRYPQIKGYPHIFVLDSDGKLLHSQDTAELEEGKGYNLARFTAFLEKWSEKQ